MRRSRTASVLLVCVALLGADARPPERFDVVVIDAGHGGEDAGAQGPAGTFEKEVVLAVSRALAGRLRARGLEVVMTREDDAFVPLERRTAIANDARGDLFVSIHANAARDARVRGIETYFLALDASDASAAAVARRENQAFGEAERDAIAAIDDPFIALLGDLITTEYMQESSEFARLAQTELAGADSTSRGVKQALFVVLTGVQMPAALVEVGFITNESDEQVLGSARGRGGLVEALERAVVAFGQRYDARRGAGVPAKGE